jgi:hypothetical protein
MIRDDLSSNLIHLTRGDTKEIVVQKFKSIINEGKLHGSSKGIRGKHKVICFSETPISKLSINLANPNQDGIRYAPFGIIFPKQTIFHMGGRPVIYQTNAEYDTLGEAHRYRHVKYEPDISDYTWEREWRLLKDELVIDFNIATIIVPTRPWVEQFKEQHISQVAFLSSMLELPFANKMIHHFVVLEDLGIKFSDEYKTV